MATNEVPRGPISDHVADNVKRLRGERRWSLAELSEQMTLVGRPMLPSGLHRLEQGKRRVDVDDLVALAAALDVAPVSLLLPYTVDGNVRLTGDVQVKAANAWAWMRANHPLYPSPKGDPPTDKEGLTILLASFFRDSLPPGARTSDQTAAAVARSLLKDLEMEEAPENGEHPEAP